MGWIFKRATARLMDRRQTTKDEEIYNRHWFPGLKERASERRPGALGVRGSGFLMCLGWGADWLSFTN